MVFTNHSATTCSLVGYPGAAALDAAGHQFAQARRTLDGMIAGCGCSRPERVTLTSGASASAVVEGDNGGGDECLRVRSILVTAPNTRTSVRLTYPHAYDCRLQVHPVVPGTNGGNRH